MDVRIEPGSLEDFLPNAFYDLIIYFFPAVYLLVGTIFIDQSVQQFFARTYSLDLPTFDKVILLAVILVGLFIAGHLISVFSSLIFRRIQGRLLSLVFDVGDYYDVHEQKRVQIRIMDPTISREIVKDSAKSIMARNNALVSLILLVISVMSPERSAVLFFAVLTIVFSVEMHFRFVWLTESVWAIHNELKPRNHKKFARKTK